jgi:thiosulfate/3-mercaptopyruvate sulfurtransferase
MQMDVKKVMLVGLVVFFALSIGASPLLAASGWSNLISVEQLKAELSNPKLVILDARKGDDAVDRFSKGHIPASQFVKYSDVAPHRGGFESEMPEPGNFESVMRKAGVNNDSLVVVVADAMNPNAFAFGPRLYWTLKNFGFENVYLLNGGITSWKNAGEEIAQGAPSEVEKEGNFTAVGSDNYRYHATKDDVIKALKENRDVIDARSMPVYLGLSTKPGWLQLGHIDGAKFAYYGMLFNSKGEYRGKEELEQIFSDLKLNLDTHTISHCGDGYGCMDLWFAVSEILGKEHTMYDAGMFEWDIPTSTKLQN